jgi:hypothetical protein
MRELRRYADIVKCDAGPLNGVYGSGCSKDCQLCGYCGDGKIDDEAGEECKCFGRNTSLSLTVSRYSPETVLRSELISTKQLLTLVLPRRQRVFVEVSQMRFFWFFSPCIGALELLAA